MFHVLNYGKDKTVVIHPFPGKIDEKRAEGIPKQVEEIGEMISDLYFDDAQKNFLDMI